MENKKEEVVVKKRIKIVNILIALIIIYIVCLYTYKLFTMKINNIFIENNSYLTDQEIIDISGLRDYPSFMLTTKYQIKKDLLKNDLIDEVKIKKNLDKSITLKITEATPLFIYNDKVILSNNKQIKLDIDLPIITNTIEDTIFNKLITKYQDIDDEIKQMISEIEYVPNDIDKERFIFTMNDGNYVYITLYKITSINEYIKIISNKEIEEKKGILYLDSGNYFQTIE